MFSQPTAGTPSNTSHLASQNKRSRPVALGPARAIRAFSIVLVPMLLLGLAACSSPFTPRATATPVVPTATAAPPTATPEPAVATVNGERLTVREFDAQVAQYKAAQSSLGKTITDEDAAKAVLDDIISQVLLAQGAHIAGFELSDSAVQARLDALQQRAGGPDQLRKWETDNGYDSPDAFLAALKRSMQAAWMRDKIVTGVPRTADQVHVQEILLYNEGDANAVREQLKVGADFNALAAQYDGNTRGDLGWFPRGYVLEPKIEEAAFALQVGGYSDVLQTDAGFVIIKLLERDASHPLSPDAYLALQNAALKAWIVEQRNAAAVVLAP